jgi:hypothetical protein
MLLRLLLALSIVSAPAAAQVGGSAFVLDRYGAHMPGNTFERLDAVFFSAGRGVTCTGSPLADGDYYFQITDPAGTVLLSSDLLEDRRVRVTGGLLAQYLGTKHLASRKGPCGSLYLRLLPFLPTPYPIHEYKVWLTRVQDYDPLLTNLFGFDPALSKSDNFRVLPGLPAQSILRGHKYYDYDHNGVWNPQTNVLEVPIGGWRVELYRNNVLDGVTFTDQDGWYVFIRDRDSAQYQVREVAPGGFVNDATPGAKWLATTARTGNVSATAEYVYGPEFGNVVYVLAPGAGRPVRSWCDADEGRPILLQCDFIWRVALNTRNGLANKLRNPVSNDNPSASIFSLNLPPQSFNGAWANYRSWCEKTSHDHAGFLLSRELAATLLSISCGNLSGSIYIDRFQDGVLVSLDDMLTMALGLVQSVGAGLTGPNDLYQDLRHMMQMCTNEFGRINDTGEPGAPQVVYRQAENPPRIATPYEN